MPKSAGEQAWDIPIARTDLTEVEIQSVLGPLRSGWLVQGPHVREFEEKWSHFTGVEYSVAVTSCTSALHLSLFALGAGPSDEVIVPAFTGISERPANHAVRMLSHHKTQYGLSSEDFPGAWVANECSISLPLFHGMTQNEQDHVIREVLGEHF